MLDPELIRRVIDKNFGTAKRGRPATSKKSKSDDSDSDISIPNSNSSNSDNGSDQFQRKRSKKNEKPNVNSNKKQKFNNESAAADDDDDEAPPADENDDFEFEDLFGERERAGARPNARPDAAAADDDDDISDPDFEGSASSFNGSARPRPPPRSKPQPRPNTSRKTKAKKSRAKRGYRKRNSDDEDDDDDDEGANTSSKEDDDEYADIFKKNDFKFDLQFDYTGIKLKNLSEFNGGDLKSDKGEARRLRAVFDDAKNFNASSFRSDDPFKTGELENKYVHRIKCKLCRCVSVMAPKDISKRKSYNIMIDLDKKLCTKVKGTELFQMLANAFNMHELKMARLSTKTSALKPLFVTWNEVKIHMREHDNDNTIRPLMEMVRKYSELIDKIEPTIIGEVETRTGKKIIFNASRANLFNTLATKMMMFQEKLHKRIMELQKAADSKERDGVNVNVGLCFNEAFNAGMPAIGDGDDGEDTGVNKVNKNLNMSGLGKSRHATGYFKATYLKA